MKYKILILSTLLSFVFSILYAHGQTIDSLAKLIPHIQKGDNDPARLDANAVFKSGFEKLLNEKGSFERNFDSLKNVSVVMPEDKRFRIYTWVVPHVDGSEYEYFGFIQLRSPVNDSIELHSLNDSTHVILKPESEKLNPRKWFGAVYYGVQITKKSKNTYYTLFGWKGKNERETQKVIEVISLVKNKLQFGLPIFKLSSVYKSRIVFTYDARASMTLNYDKNFGGIVFDHLSLNKRADFTISGPDGTYDAFRWKKGRWQLYKDIDVRTYYKPKEELPVPPLETPGK